jgi:hypothetical protein
VLLEYVTKYYITATTHAKMNPFVLSSQNTSLKRGAIIWRTILITDKPMKLEKINISFKKHFGLNFGIGLADQWNFHSIYVLDMQSYIRLYNVHHRISKQYIMFSLQFSYKFCPPSSSSMIKSGSNLTYQRC